MSAGAALFDGTFLRKLWNVVTNIPRLYGGAGRKHAATLPDDPFDLENDIDIPDEFKDPISFSAMKDPVVLVATGQVYDYDNLREWFVMGKRVCPSSNRPVCDAHICRLLALKERINCWRAENGLPIAPPETYDDFAELDEKIPTHVKNLKSGISKAVLQAMIDMNNMMCRWQGETDKATARSKEIQAKLRNCIMEDLILAVRYGDSYMQGIAANLLGFADTEEEFGWLTACAAVPLCNLLFSPNQYANQAASRVIMNLCRRNENSKEVFRNGGIVEGMLKQLQSPDKFPYCRSMAASCLFGMASVAACREEIVQRGGKQLLLDVLAETTSRFEKSDCALALLVVGVSEEDLAPLVFELKDLFRLSYCSSAWLKGEVESPQDGLTSTDRARIELLHRSVNRSADIDIEEFGWLHDLNGEIELDTDDSDPDEEEIGRAVVVTDSSSEEDEDEHPAEPPEIQAAEL
ncbi:hypothetical protein BSKO_08414 [Bryopsis sp. KO-2023]|nr:hypothetical protein BSKO_08414 [Bryopsis sp. KO-2023]